MKLFFYIFLAVVLLLVFIAYEVRWRDRIKSRWLQGTFAVILPTVVAPVIYFLLSDWLTWEDREKEDQLRKAIIAAIEERGTETGAIEALIQLKHQEVFQSTREEAAEWAKHFLSSLPERRIKLTKIEKAGEELARRLRAKWQPIYDFALMSLDARVASLSSSTSITTVPRKPGSLLVTTGRRMQQEVRRVKFPGDSQLVVSLDQGVIVRGTLTHFPRLFFKEMGKGRNNILFSLQFKPDSVELLVDIKHLKFLPHGSLKGDLMSSQNRELVVGAINHTIEWIFPIEPDTH